MIGLQIIANGLIAASVYALVAMGFTLIYHTNKFVHFAHGSTVTLAAYLFYFLVNDFATPIIAAIPLAIFLTAVVCFGIFKALYQPLQRSNASSAVLLIASIALMILLENLTLLLFGAGAKTIDIPILEQGIVFAGVNITALQVISILLSIDIAVLMFLFLSRTTYGHKLRAVADHPELARTTGINTDAVHATSFVLASVLASIAGIIVALEQSIDPLLGTPLIIKSFASSVIGGITSVPGAVLGSYLLGLIENIGIWFLPSAWKDAIAFLLLFLFLIARPAGLLGTKKSIRE